MITINLLSKSCTRCKASKMAREFMPLAIGGLMSMCVSCRETNRKAHHKYIHKDKETMMAKRRHEAENRLKRLALPSNPEAKICRRCKKQLSVKAFSLSRNGALYKLCDGCREYSRTRLSAHKSLEDIEESRKQSTIRNRRVRQIVLDHYGRKCACCGDTHEEFLALDHEHGNGAQHRRDVGYGSSIYRWLIKNNFPDGFRLLCHNCNASRGYYGYCPHDMEPVIGEDFSSVKPTVDSLLSMRNEREPSISSLFMFPQLKPFVQ